MSETPTMVGDKPAALGSGSLLYQMLQSEEYTDLDFSCRGRVYRVHKAVVCPQSPVIKVAVTAGFKVRTFFHSQILIPLFSFRVIPLLTFARKQKRRPSRWMHLCPAP